MPINLYCLCETKGPRIHYAQIAHRINVAWFEPQHFEETRFCGAVVACLERLRSPLEGLLCGLRWGRTQEKQYGETCDCGTAHSRDSTFSSPCPQCADLNMPRPRPTSPASAASLGFGSKV